LNPRLVFFLCVSMLAGVLAGGLAVAAGWGLLLGILLYSGVGSSTLVTLAFVWPDRPIQVVRTPACPAREPAAVA
jgi:hypothetical protein